MIKTPILAASAVTLLMSATALAGSQVLPAGAMNPAAMVHTLVEDGLDLRSLEVRHGTYLARIGTGSGEVVTVGIDPQSAMLTDAFSSVPARRDAGPAPTINAAQAIIAAAHEGYWDIGAVELKRGAWRVQAQNGNIFVDATSGNAQTQPRIAEL